MDLRIFSLRPDGFHEIQTLLQSIYLYDTLSFRQRPGPLTVRSRSSGLPLDKANIVWTAASVLWSAIGRHGIPTDVAISIRKRIPISAGLGGGSSDAACALRGLCAVWGIKPNHNWLKELASFIGSDVAYFIDGGTAIAKGRGEQVRRVREIDPLWVVLAQPKFGISTATAYRWFDLKTAQRPIGLRQSLPRSWRQSMHCLANDLEPFVVHQHPEIGLMVERFKKANALMAAMTGSGSAVFGLFKECSAARAARLAVRRPGWRTSISRTIGRAEFARITVVSQTQ